MLRRSKTVYWHSGDGRMRASPQAYEGSKPSCHQPDQQVFTRRFTTMLAGKVRLNRFELGSGVQDPDPSARTVPATPNTGFIAHHAPLRHPSGPHRPRRQQGGRRLAAATGTAAPGKPSLGTMEGSRRDRAARTLWPAGCGEIRPAWACVYSAQGGLAIWPKRIGVPLLKQSPCKRLVYRDRRSRSKWLAGERCEPWIMG